MCASVALASLELCCSAPQSTAGANQSNERLRRRGHLARANQSESECPLAGSERSGRATDCWPRATSLQRVGAASICSRAKRISAHLPLARGRFRAEFGRKWSQKRTSWRRELHLRQLSLLESSACLPVRYSCLFRLLARVHCQITRSLARC